MNITKKNKRNRFTFTLKTTLAAAAVVMIPVLAGCAAGTQEETVQTTMADTAEVSGAETVTGTNAPGTYRQVSSEEAAQMMESEKDYIILDVRRQDEFSSGHIPGAINIANETISEDSVKDVLPDKDQRIFIYCRSGNRSKQASEKLAQMGYNNIIEFGGIRSWKGAIE